MIGRRVPPVWLLGMTNLSFGLYTGFLVLPLPQALSAQHVAESTIASTTALVVSPTFFCFLLGPILDVRFSRRWYASVLTLLASLLLGISILFMGDLLVVKIAATIGCAAIVLANGALGGWLASISGAEDENRLGTWITIGNICGVGVISVFAGEALRAWPLPAVAAAVAGLVLVPLAIFPWIPAPGPDRRLASESFRAFSGDLLNLVRRPSVLVAIALFVAPCGTFALTNLLGGLGNDFHASARVVNWLGGIGSAIAGVFGSLLLPPLARRVPIRPLYLMIGIGGAMFTLSMLLLPRTAGAFSLTYIGEQAVQSLAIACSMGITFEVIGQNNPLAATTFALLNAAYNFPITYMLIVDGWGYAWRRIDGAFLVDAGLGMSACLLVGLLLPASRGKSSESRCPRVERGAEAVQGQVE